MKKPVITTPTQAVRAAAELVTCPHKEHFIGLYLNGRNSLKKAELISLGTLDCSLVHPRETFRPALVLPSAAVIVLHNHPSGDVTPSEADIQITKKLKAASNILDITLLDHIVFVGVQKFYSFKEHGLL